MLSLRGAARIPRIPLEFVGFPFLDLLGICKIACPARSRQDPTNFLRICGVSPPDFPGICGIALPVVIWVVVRQGFWTAVVRKMQNVLDSHNLSIDPSFCFVADVRVLDPAGPALRVMSRLLP